MIVLVVEDDENSRLLLEAALATQGYEVIAASNGREALEKVQDKSLDMIISDILMPEMDGYALCRALKADPEHCKAPFVFYSATYTDPKDEELAMSLGAEKFLLKPMEITLLLAEVNEILRGAPSPRTLDSCKLGESFKSELDIEKQYSARLARKLEKKVHELEQYKTNLEGIVKVRTNELSQAVEQLTREVEARKEAEKKAQAAKDFMADFMATVSHELRTPMTSVMGFAKLIRSDLKKLLPEHSDESKRKTRIFNNLSIVSSESERLLELVNGLLDLARVEAGAKTSRNHRIDLSPLTQRVADMALALVEGRPVEIVQDMKDELPSVECNPDEILQVLINLLSNAAKYTHSGSITLRTFARDNEVCVQVEDTGVGVDAEKLETIFEKYTRVDADETHIGTGLGLAICREIAICHNGTISAQSTPGQGSVFTLCLPAAPGSDENA